MVLWRRSSCSYCVHRYCDLFPHRNFRQDMIINCLEERLNLLSVSGRSIGNCACSVQAIFLSQAKLHIIDVQNLAENVVKTLSASAIISE